MLSLATLAPSAYTLSTPLVSSSRASVRMEVPPPPPSAFTADVAPAAPVSVPDTPPPLPKIKTMMVGDGTLAGDMSFDPAGFSKDPASLAWYREAEIKHARLAMVAAIGWPISELTNFGGLLTADGRAPALLNGGLGDVSGLYWAGVAAVAAYWEGRTFDKMFGAQDDYLPGMLKFDPLGMDAEWSRNAEIMNGRLAMIAITAFAIEEAVTKAAIFPINVIVGTPAAAAGAGATKPALIAGATSILDPNSLPDYLMEPVAAPPPSAEPIAAVAEAATDAVAAVSEVAATAAAAVPEVAATLSPIGDALF